MRWVQRHSWWLLLTMTVLIAVIGLSPIVFGIREDPSIPLAITGMTFSELETSSAPAYRLLDLDARSLGIDLIVIGTLLSVIVFKGYRQHRPWAWWTMWILPVWAASIVVLTLAYGVSPGQAPPTPIFSGAIFSVLAGAILILSAPLFLGRRPAES